MKLLFDENLSPWLPINLADLYPGSIHVRDVGLKSEPDQDVWQYAKKNNFAIVTKDSDFAERSIFEPIGPVVLWIRSGNGSTRQLEGILRLHHESLLAHLSKASTRNRLIELR